MDSKTMRATIQKALDKLKVALNGVSDTRWPDARWGTTQCAEHPSKDNCACIVYRGDYKTWEDQQNPPYEYIADAESEGIATWVALLDPTTGAAFIQFLEVALKGMAGDESHPECTASTCIDFAAYDVAKAILAGQETGTP